MLMRLAGTHLITAEVYFNTGDNASAADHLNTVRRRAARPGNEAAMEITAGDVDLEFILNERARELVGEMHRWFDLVRTNTLVERVRQYNREGASNSDEHHTLRPIPQEQIDRTNGGYPQNEGY